MRCSLVWIVVLLATITTAGQSAPKLEVTSPSDGSYVSGMVTIAAILVPLAAERDIARASFFADGVNVCTVERRPYTCVWNAGQAVRAHQIRVVVELASGQRLVKTLRTRGVDVGESTGVSAVKVTATVKDGEGRFVAGLTPADQGLHQPQKRGDAQRETLQPSTHVQTARRHLTRLHRLIRFHPISSRIIGRSPSAGRKGCQGSGP